MEQLKIKMMKGWQSFQNSSEYQWCLGQIKKLESYQPEEPAWVRDLPSPDKLSYVGHSASLQHPLRSLLAPLYERPVQLENMEDEEKNIRCILQRYYRTPGLESLFKPDAFKGRRLHGCDHVLRVRNNALWLMALFSQHGFYDFTNKEQILLGYAAIYHDAAAEEVSKADEEELSAGYFKRDMIANFPSCQNIIEDIVLALSHKEHDVNGQGDDDQLSTGQRAYLRVLRAADRLDIARCNPVGRDFPDFCPSARPDNKGRREVNAAMFDIPVEWIKDKPAFTRQLVAACHGSVDLAVITGGVNDDQRQQGGFTSRYGLQPAGENIRQWFNVTAYPLAELQRFIDNNARRKMAALAGLKTCTDRGEGRHTACAGQDSSLRIDQTRYIHNEYHDLSQIRLPDGMTLLEKMIYVHDPGLIRPEIQGELQREISRLQKEGILRSIGIPSQKALKNRKVAGYLRKHRGLHVHQEKRIRSTELTAHGEQAYRYETIQCLHSSDNCHEKCRETQGVGS